MHWSYFENYFAARGQTIPHMLYASLGRGEVASARKKAESRRQSR
jgi:hypothetical protein